MQILILGGGYAGLLCALRLVGKHTEAQVTLVNAQSHFTERIRLHQRAAGGYPNKHAIPHLLRGRNVTFLQGWVQHLDADKQQVSVNTTDGQRSLTYDWLVYALGSTVDRTAIPGLQDHAYTLDGHGERDATALCEAAQQLSSGRLVVIGGGLTGIEAATELAENYPALDVHLVTGGEFGSDLSVEGQTYLRATFRDMGIAVQENTRAQSIHADYIQLDDGQNLPYDLCVWAGAFTVPALARDAGLAVNARGQILTDPYLRARSHPAIYAVGDAAHIVTSNGEALRMACATAMPAGAHAADNIGARLHGQPETPFDFAYLFRCISLGRRRGLIQWVTENDQPRPWVTTGWPGALVKEFINRFTIWALKLERWFSGAYRWPNQPDQSVTPEDTTRYEHV